MMRAKFLKDWIKYKKKYEKFGMGIMRFQYEDSVALLYHENSKLTPISSKLFGMSIEKFNDPYYLKRAAQPFNVYPGREILKLKAQDSPICNNIFDLIENRKSVRNYNQSSITLSHMYYLLHYSYGICRKSPINGVEKGFWYYRTVPSGGALYPLEIYPIVLRGEFGEGIYHYRPDIEAIELIKKGNYYPEMREMLFAEPNIELANASLVVIISSMFETTMLKYGERGYRFILLEAGFVSMNISLVCEALGLGSCMVGGYLDDELHRFLGIDGASEAVMNVMVIGGDNDRDKEHKL